MPANISTDLKNQLIELSCDKKFKEMFNENSLEVFGYLYAQEVSQN